MSSALQPRRDYPQPASAYPPPDTHATNNMNPGHPYQNQYPNPASSNVFTSNLPSLPNPFHAYAPQHQMPNPGGMTSSQTSAPPVTAPVRDLRNVGVVRNGKRYSLEVRQQPQRARMCGFGDKDRRPITPPPCVRLVITNSDTGKEVDPNSVDPTFFVLSVDLWDNQASNEVNLVRHSSSSPAVSISAATMGAYPPPPERPWVGVINPNGQHPYYPGMVAGQVPPPPMVYGQPTHIVPYNHLTSEGQPGYLMASQQPVHIMPTHNAGMFTRNLIGSLVVNAAKLEDPNKKVGLWFVLQDLSVRTEGVFRLKMNFIDVADPNGNGSLTTDSAPVLASCYSDTFQVYSAKKFPGVVESTPLSKAFASQGVKIPIRKDVPKIANRDEYENDPED